jgi:hypothetical protein
MTIITVSDEQARLICESPSPIVIIDARGHELGKLNRTARSSPTTYELSANELSELTRRANSPGPGVTTQGLLARLQSLAPIEG